MKELIVIFTFVVTCVGGQQTCTTTRWPYDATNNYSGYDNVDAATGSGFLMEAVEYHTPDACTCGVLKKWIFYAKAAGPLELQVWDHIDHQSYQLKGENYFTVPGSATDKTIEYLVPERDRITIRNNYLIGWYSSASGIIGYKEGVESYSDESRREPSMTNLDPAHEPTFDWSSGSSVVIRDRIYAFGAEVTENTAPAFTNLPREVWIYGDETAGAFIYKVSADDIDSKDVSSLFIYDIAEESTSQFYYDRSLRTIFLAVSKPAVGTYNMTFEVQDQCLNSAQATLTIKVLNWSPSLTNLPSFATLSEDTDYEVVLFTVQYADRDNSTLTHALNVSPANADFTVKNVGHDQSNRSVVTSNGVSFNYETAQQYIMDYTLNDGEFRTKKGYFMLYITKNNPPKFTNLNNGARATVTYGTAAKGDMVYQVNTTDAENDDLTFAMTCDPSGCPLEIDGDNGVVSITQDFVGSVYGPGWDLAITVSDGTTTVGPRSLSVLVLDINDVPQIINLGLTDAIAVHEGTPLGTTVYSIQYVDIDSTDTHTFHVTYDQTWAYNYFELNLTTGVITTANNILDYEELNSPWTTIATITLSDSLDTATGTLTIHIRNVNEAPYFHQTKYTFESREQGSRSRDIGGWDPTMSDPDNDIATPLDTHSYTMDCGDLTRYFRMDRNSGAMNYFTKFDYDTVNFTAPFDCIVTVTDRAGLTATTTLVIDIKDNNENKPMFFSQTDNYIFQVPSLEPGRFVGQVTATDADRSAEYNEIHYFIQTSPFPKDYILINDFGNIYVNESWTSTYFYYDVSYEFVIRAMSNTDRDGTRRSASATVTLFISGTSTVVPVTTDRPFKFIEDNRNVAWLTVAITFGVLLLIIVCGFMMMYTVQIKRYRWCIPWCRKYLLGLKDMTRREKKRYYQGLLLQEELDEMEDEESDEYEDAATALHPIEDDDKDTAAPPMLWSRLKAKGEFVARGPTVRKANIPRAAVYDEPKPQLKKDASKSLMRSDSDFWNS